MDTQKVINYYTEYVLKHNKRHSSVFDFCQELKLEESEFYNHFSSFDQLEAVIFSKMVDNAISLTVKENEENENSMDAKHQLLTFYLTLVEVFKSNRSLLVFLLPKCKSELGNLKKVQKSRESFFNFLSTLDIPLDVVSFLPDRSIKEKTINAAAWIQFISILKYWLQDHSKGFEKTDIFIEKSLKLSFEISESTLLNSIVDLGKFMMKKK
jgi:hypothetical protein